MSDAWRIEKFGTSYAIFAGERRVAYFYGATEDWTEVEAKANAERALAGAGVSGQTSGEGSSMASTLVAKWRAKIGNHRADGANCFGPLNCTACWMYKSLADELEAVALNASTPQVGPEAAANRAKHCTCAVYPVHGVDPRSDGDCPVHAAAKIAEGPATDGLRAAVKASIEVHAMGQDAEALAGGDE